MAKIFIVYGTSQHGEVIEMPWLKCVEIFELNDFCRGEDRPKFGVRDTSPQATDIVVQLEADEAETYRTTAGYFICPLGINEAVNRLNDTLNRHATGGA
jgi:hypothetical protein